MAYSDIGGCDLPTAAAQQVADPQKGLALALKDCAPCHGVAKGEHGRQTRTRRVFR